MRYILVFLLAILFVPATSFSTGRIKGKVADKQTNEPLVGSPALVRLVGLIRMDYLLWLGRLNDAQSLLRKNLPLKSSVGAAPPEEESTIKAWIAFERGRFAKSRSLLEIWETIALP